MPLIRATANWIASNLIIPQVGAVHHPRGSAIAVSDEVAEWLIANQYAELDNASLSESIPEPNHSESGKAPPPTDNVDWMEGAIEWLNIANLEEISEIKGISTSVAKSLHESRPVTKETLESLTKSQQAAIQKHLS